MHGKRARRYYGALRFRVGWRRRVGAIALFALIAGSVVLPFVDIEPIRAATLELMPNTDVSTGWIPSTGTTHYALVDELSSAPVTTDYISTGTAGAGGEVEEFGLTTTTNVDSVSNITVYIYAYSATNANGGNLDTVDVNLRVDGTLQTATTVTPVYSATGVYTWYSASFSGSWSQSQLDGAQVYLIHNRIGGGGPSGQDDDIRIATIYASITYTQTVLFDQSSYRWFDNQDSAPTTFAQTWGGANTDAGYAVASDSAGNVYVAGYTNSTGLTSGRYDQLIVKYNAAGVELWSRTWGSDTGDDYAYGIVVHGSYIYVVGKTNYGSSSLAASNHSLLRLDSVGSVSASRVWGDNLTNNLYQAASYGVDVDASGNVYVVGTSNHALYTSGGGYDLVAAKFNASLTLQWTRTWGGTGTEEGNAVAVDDSGNLYIAGSTDSTGYAQAGADQVLMKINTAGQRQWTKTWGGDLADEAYGIALDSMGHIYTAGYTASTDLTAGGNDQTLVKYDSSGAELWSVTWGDSSGSETAASIAIDGSSNVFVSGFTSSTSLTSGSNDHTVVKYNSSGVEQWSQTWGGTGSDSGRGVAVSADDFVYTTGNVSSSALTFSGYDLPLIKYDRDNGLVNCSSCASRSMSEVDRTDTTTIVDNTQVIVSQTGTNFSVASSGALRLAPQTLVHCGLVGSYLRTWGGATVEEANDAVVDTAGNIYVTGETDSNNYTSGGLDQVLVKYDASGVEQWTKTWGGDGEDTSSDIAIDATGNIYTIGNTASTGLTAGGADQTLVKYDSSGAELWSVTWGGDGTDYAMGLALDGSGNIFVVGTSKSTGLSSETTYGDQTLVKYNSSGVEQWTKTWGAGGYDVAREVSLDSSGNIYVAGSTQSSAYTTDTTYGDLTLVKYDALGVEQWTKTWGGDNADAANSLAVDSSGNVYITGYTYSTGFTAGSADHVLIKFNSSGVYQWAKTWGGTGTEVAFDIVLDSERNIYVAGYATTSTLSVGGYDVVLMKYDASGIEQWTKTWGGTSNDAAYGMTLDGAGNAILVGWTESTNLTSGGADQLLIKIPTDTSGCGGICVSRTTSETGRSITVSDHTNIIEVDRTESTLLVDRSDTTAIVDRSVTEVVRNEVFLSPSVDLGSVRAAANTAATAPSEGAPFRLRMSLHVGIATAEPSLASFKLQIAPRGEDGVCDTGFSGETYADLSSTSGAIRYYNNTNASDGMGLTINANDPTHSSDNTVYQSYEESNNFTVSRAIPTGEDGLWDFALVDYDAPASTTYCFRAVSSAGSALNGYAVVPQLTTASSTLSQESYRTYENEAASLPTFAKTLGGSGSDSGYSVVPTSDGGYATTGYTASYGAGGADLLLSKYDANGDLDWYRTWGGSGTDQGQTLVYTKDGGFVITGNTNSFNGTGYDMLIVKYSATGTLEWSRAWGETVNNEYGYKVIQTSDGGYAVSGRSQSYGAGGYDVFLAKYTSNGTLEWSRTWGGTGDDSSYAVIQTSDGGYALTGQTKSYQETTNGEAFLAKYTSNGTLEWSRTWGGTGIDYGYSVIQTDDGGYITAGDSSSYGAGGLDSFVAKYTSDGTLSWSRTWGGAGSDYGRMVLATSDGGFVTAGVTASYGAGGTDMYYAKYTSDGTLSWSRTWGGTGNEYLRSLAVTADGGYVGTGDTASYGVGGIEMFLVKYDSSGSMFGCSSAICKSPTVTLGSPTPNTTSPSPGTSSPSATTGSPTATLNTPTPSTTVVVDTPSTFIKTMDGAGLDTVAATIPASDGGYIATGTAYGLGAGGNDLFVAKYKTDGTLAWMRTWGGTGEETSQGIVATSDGGYVVAGYTNSYGAGGYDMVLLKYAADGTLSWFRLWGGTAADVAYSLATVGDGGFVIIGRTQSFGDVNNDVFVVKYDSSGTLQWSRTWGGSGVEYGSSVSQTSDGGFVVVGDTASSGAGSADMFLTKYASDGTLSWSRTWGGSASDYGKSVVQTADGGYAVGGYTSSYGAGDSDVFLAKYTSDGTLSWSRTWGGTGADTGYLVAQATDGGLALTGYTASYGAGNNDALFLKYTSDGTLSWSRTWGGTGLDLSNFIAQTDDGGYIAGGQTKSFGDTTNGDMFIARLDGYGDVKGCALSNCTSPIGRLSSPTPAVGVPTITTATPTPTETTTTAGTSSPTPTFTARVAVAPVTQFQNGATVAATNSRAELLSTDMVLRLRIGLKNNGKTYATTGAFKLQSGASTIGTCDPATTSYTDVSGASSPIAFYDNGRMASGDKVHLDVTDPLVANTRETMQSYVEATSFSNPRELAVNDLGVWDFALKADGSKIGNTYCFRIVESGASLNGGYSQYAEVYIPPAMDSVMRHGSFFNSRGVQQPYAWGRE